MKTFSDNLGPVHTFLNSFSNGDVCYGLAYRPRLSGENGTENASFKNPLRRGDLWERRFVLVWMDENGGFFESDPIMVLVTSKCASSHERLYRFLPTIQKRKKWSWILFWKRRKEMSVFKRKRIRVHGLMVVSKSDICLETLFEEYSFLKALKESHLLLQFLNCFSPLEPRSFLLPPSSPLS